MHGYTYIHIQIIRNKTQLKIKYVMKARIMREKNGTITKKHTHAKQKKGSHSLDTH